ncbi:hypothetical protein HNY73_000939 [Argiope bruennichi]|uniref:Uncharacterized protein n=1 Tax=Argiope bruennichi TaxID=94029 RepID=A0A8T0G3F2_ARGBR|nr:hypothetical protein HNY73_000939 [Argiope bruennichi]
MSTSDKGLQAKFDLLSKSSGGKDGKVSLENIKKWLMQAGVIGKDTGITDSDVDSVFSKSTKDKKEIDFAEFKEFISALAGEKGMNLKDLTEKLGGKKSEEKEEGAGKVPGGCK